VTLLEAWSILAGRYGIKPTLVIAGGKGWFYETLEARTRTLGLTDSVRYLGYVPDGELPALYARLSTPGGDGLWHARARFGPTFPPGGGWRSGADPSGTRSDGVGRGRSGVAVLP